MASPASRSRACEIDGIGLDESFQGACSDTRSPRRLASQADSFGIWAGVASSTGRCFDDFPRLGDTVRRHGPP